MYMDILDESMVLGDHDEMKLDIELLTELPMAFSSPSPSTSLPSAPMSLFKSISDWFSS